jgi:hypothetical protein
MVKQHQNTCRSQWDVTVVANARSVTELQIKEAIMIKTMRPTLNNRDEIASLQLI